MGRYINSFKRSQLSSFHQQKSSFLFHFRPLNPNILCIYNRLPKSSLRIPFWDQFHSYRDTLNQSTNQIVRNRAFYRSDKHLYIGLSFHLLSFSSFLVHFSFHYQTIQSKRFHFSIGINRDLKLFHNDTRLCTDLRSQTYRILNHASNMLSTHPHKHLSYPTHAFQTR